MSTDINNVAAEIARGLAEYDQSVANDIKKIVDDVATEGVNELKQTSPKLTGSYRRGWRKNSHTATAGRNETQYSTKQIISLHTYLNMDTPADMAGG